jgi:hypothetical protein
MLLAGALGVMLLTVTHQVQGLEEELGGLHRDVATERQKMHVLQAEFSLLVEPERLRRLAGAHLGLVPVEPVQLGTFATLDKVSLQDPGGAEALPARSPAARAATSREHRR